MMKRTGDGEVDFRTEDNIDDESVTLVISTRVAGVLQETRITMSPSEAQNVGGWLASAGRRVQEACLTPEQRAQWAMEDDEELWK